MRNRILALFSNSMPYEDRYYECGLFGDHAFGAWLGFHSTGLDGGAVEITDQGGYIPSPQEWEELKRRVDVYYSHANAAAIAHNNLEISRHHGFLLPIAEPKPEKPRLLIQGHVYILLAENGRYKIGRAKTLKTRLKSLRTASPLSFTLAHTIESADTVRAESFLHHRFAEQRTHGEWFDLTPEDFAWIQSLSDFDLDVEVAA